jgi:glycosyltransferase involved in cell wall biosynthesis
MKILVVYPYVPWPLDRGTHHRTFHLLTALAASHDVSLVALAADGEGAAHASLFRQFCRTVEIIPFVHPPWQKLFPHRLLNPVPPNVAHWTLPAVARRLREIVRGEQFDAIHVCDIVMAQFFLTGDVPLVVDRSRVDLQFQLAEHRRMNFPLRARLLRGEGYLKLWLYERKIARRSRLEIVCGPDDAAFLRRWVSPRAPLEVLVNGVDLDYFSPPARPDQRAPRPTLLFCGAMDYNPNIDALRWYFSQMHDWLRHTLPDLEVVLAGKVPIPEVLAYGQRPGVTVTGGVPDVRPYYRRAWVQMVPLRIGGGTRLKIVESLAMGTPVISTRIGAQGLDLQHEDEILLADDARGFAQQIARALGDANLRRQLAANGLRAARARFSWKMIGARLNALYEARVSRSAIPRHSSPPGNASTMIRSAPASSH